MSHPDVWSGGISLATIKAIDECYICVESELDYGCYDLSLVNRGWGPYRERVVCQSTLSSCRRYQRDHPDCVIFEVEDGPPENSKWFPVGGKVFRRVKNKA